MQTFFDKKTNERDVWRGKDYSEYATFQHEKGFIFINKHLNEFLKNQPFSKRNNFKFTCLDFGCGTGEIIKALGEVYPHGTFIGIDPSKSMIDQARAKPLSTNVQFKLIGANGPLPFTDHSIDVVWATFVLQWVENKIGALKEIARVLKPEGKFFSITPLFHEYVDNLRETMTKEEKWVPYFTGFKDPISITRNSRPEIYEKAYKEAGLIVDHSEIRTMQLEFSRENLIKFLSIITPHLAVFEKNEDKTRFMNDYVDRYLKKYPHLPDGTCVISFDFLEVAVHSPALKLENALKAKL